MRSPPPASFTVAARLGALLLLTAGLPQATARAAGPRTEADRTFYAVGVNVARRLRVFDLSPAELKVVQRGLEDAVRGSPALDPRAYSAAIDKLASARTKGPASRQKDKAASFLASAAREKGAVRTASGLVYRELRAGTGPAAQASDLVTVRYTASLADGTVYDSTDKRGKPLTVRLDEVMRCWNEGVPRMKVGGRARLVCPSELTYGDAGREPSVPGGAAVAFDVELLRIGASPTK